MNNNRGSIKRSLYNPDIVADVRLLERNLKEGLLTEDTVRQMARESEDYSKNLVVINIPVEDKQNEIISRRTPFYTPHEEVPLRAGGEGSEPPLTNEAEGED